MEKMSHRWVGVYVVGGRFRFDELYELYLQGVTIELSQLSTPLLHSYVIEGVNSIVTLALRFRIFGQ